MPAWKGRAGEAGAPPPPVCATQRQRLRQTMPATGHAEQAPQRPRQTTHQKRGLWDTNGPQRYAPPPRARAEGSPPQRRPACTPRGRRSRTALAGGQPAPLMASGDATLKTDLQATLWTFHSFFMIKQSCLEDRSAGSGRPTATATPHRPPHPLRAARHPPLLAHLSAAMSSGQPNGPRRRLYSAWITGICRQRQRPAVTASGKALERAYARHGDGGGSRRGGRRRGGGPR